MSRLYRTSAAVLVAVMLAGCSSRGMSPVAAQAVSNQALMAKAVTTVDPAVQKLIDSYNAIQGYDDAAMNQREDIVAQLGDSDSDLASSFLEYQYEHLSDFPDAVRGVYEGKLLDAMSALDTFDEELDAQTLKAGPGTTFDTMAAYYDSRLRSNRHNTFLHWVSSPFRWVGGGLKNFWAGLTGKRKPKKRHRRPTPGNYTPPSYPNTPDYGNTPGIPSYN